MEKLDNYDLINSKAIGDYCRKIKHKFNTEELAVLVYRNKKMDIERKINKYRELVEDYPDMEVIERINCNHYNSVKDLIKKEIERLTNLNVKLQKKEEGVVYFYEMYYKSIESWEIEKHEMKASFTEIKKHIEEYIKEYEDTLEYRIYKKYLKTNEPTITAEYKVIGTESVLNNIYDDSNNFLDIDNIFINLPTPFKKGDILITDRNKKFVLDYLCTWQKGLEELLTRGNRDSSDMIGYGYYILKNSGEFINGEIYDYDSFEYYDGELNGKYRTLQALSSFIKGKINIELFVHAYEEFKAEDRMPFLDMYNERGLKLAGLSEKDILKYHNNLGGNYGTK